MKTLYYMVSFILISFLINNCNAMEEQTTKIYSGYENLPQEVKDKPQTITSVYENLPKEHEYSNIPNEIREDRPTDTASSQVHNYDNIPQEALSKTPESSKQLPVISKAEKRDKITDLPKDLPISPKHDASRRQKDSGLGLAKLLNRFSRSKKELEKPFWEKITQHFEFSEPFNPSDKLHKYVFENTTPYPVLITISSHKGQICNEIPNQELNKNEKLMIGNLTDSNIQLTIRRPKQSEVKVQQVHSWDINEPGIIKIIQNQKTGLVDVDIKPMNLILKKQN